MKQEKDIERMFRQLNNSVSYNNQYHYEQGNIYLKPQYVYDTELSVHCPHHGK